MPANVISGYMAGRQFADQERARGYENQLRSYDVANAQEFQNLAHNANATPDQYARVGRPDVANYFSRQNEAAAGAQAEQQKQLATRLMQAAQYGLQSDKPKAFIEQNFPELAQFAGERWAAATDEQVKSELQGIAARFGVEAGVGPAAPKGTGALYKYLGPDGKPIYGDATTATGKIPYEKPSRGFSLTLPDGTEVQLGGDGVPQYGGVGLTKANETRLQEAFINAQGNAYALREQLAKYRPEFSTFGGKFKAGVANAKELAGMENAPQQQQFLSDYTSWKADTSSLLSQYLNQLSGAAISPAEEARLKAGFPNPDDGPTEYQAKATQTMRRFALVQARAAYLLSNPAQSLDSVSLDSMSNIITMEANRLAKSLERGGMAAEQAKQEAIAKTRARFGLDQ